MTHSIHKPTWTHNTTQGNNSIKFEGKSNEKTKITQERIGSPRYLNIRLGNREESGGSSSPLRVPCAPPYPSSLSTWVGGAWTVISTASARGNESPPPVEAEGQRAPAAALPPRASLCPSLLIANERDRRKRAGSVIYIRAVPRLITRRIGRLGHESEPGFVSLSPSAF